MTATLRRAAAALLLCALAAPAAAQNFLCEVVGLTNRVYLYGTAHAGKAEWYPLPAAVEEAFADAKVLVVEADITNSAEMAKYGGSMAYTPPDSLKDHVPAADYDRFRKLLARYRFREAEVTGMKPFMAVSLLVFAEWARQGFIAKYGVDQYLITKARAEGKPVVELEGIEAQMRLMDSLTEQESLDLFSGTVMALETGLSADQITGMVAAWRRSDPDGMLVIARSYNDRVKGAAQFEEKFIWSRHPEMVKKIEGYLTGSRERHFIAVGSLHLAGPRGLVELLRKKGYIVRER